MDGANPYMPPVAAIDCTPVCTGTSMPRADPRESHLNCLAGWPIRIMWPRKLLGAGQQDNTLVMDDTALAGPVNNCSHRRCSYTG